MMLLGALRGFAIVASSKWKSPTVPILPSLASIAKPLRAAPASIMAKVLSRIRAPGSAPLAICQGAGTQLIKSSRKRLRRTPTAAASETTYGIERT